MKRTITLCLLSLSAMTLSAQTDSVYTSSYLNKSTRFAWTTLGMDVLALQGGKTSVISNDNVVSRDFGATITPRVHIGGIHFWGHADFYVSFPLSFLSHYQKSETFQKRTNLQGIETGARLYPLALKPGKLRPFAGISFRLQSYGHQTAGAPNRYGYPVHQRMIKPVQLGLTYATRKYLISASTYIQRKSDFEYWLTPTTTGNTTLDPFSFNISVSAYWDTDRNMREKSGIRQENLKHEILKKENKFSSWYWAVGASAALQISKSPFLKSEFPYLYNDFVGGFTPDISVGRYFDRLGLSAGISYRTMGTKLEGFDSQVRMRRHSAMLEVHKDLFNYLGFVPFAGATVSMENLRTTVNDQRHTTLKPAVGIIFGWDIRVTKTGTNVLRTNLRWAPNLHTNIRGKKLMYDNLEFNFIQWVQFIGRKKTYAKYSR